MASPNSGREIDERHELEKMQKTFLERKKAVFARTKDADEEIQKITRQEMVVEKRLQELNEMEQMRHALESCRSENAKMRKELHERQIKSLREVTVRRPTADGDSRAERLQEPNLVEIRQELETLRRRNVEQDVSLRKMKDAVQRITSYSKAQQKEKEQALRRVAGLKDEIAALRQISAETQERQLDEIQSSSTAARRQQQRRSGKANELMVYLLLAPRVKELCLHFAGHREVGYQAHAVHASN